MGVGPESPPGVSRGLVPTPGAVQHGSHLGEWAQLPKGHCAGSPEQVTSRPFLKIFTNSSSWDACSHCRQKDFSYRGLTADEKAALPQTPHCPVQLWSPLQGQRTYVNWTCHFIKGTTFVSTFKSDNMILEWLTGNCGPSEEAHKQCIPAESRRPFPSCKCPVSGVSALSSSWPALGSVYHKQKSNPYISYIW